MRVLPVTKMASPSILNTVYNTPTPTPVDECSRSPYFNRFCAFESTPVLRTKLHTLDRDFSCPEKRGGIQDIQSSTWDRVPDTLWDTCVGGEDGYCTNTKIHKSDQVDRPQQLGRRKPDRDQKSKATESNQPDTPIAIRTRSKVHLQDTASKCLTTNETPNQSRFAMEIKEQFLQLNTQSDERHVEICSKIQSICNQQMLFSEQHSSMILELRLELIALKVQLASKDVAIQAEEPLVKPSQNVKLAQQPETTTKLLGQKHQDTSKVTKIQSNNGSVVPDSSKPRPSSATNQSRHDLISTMLGSTSVEEYHASKKTLKKFLFRNHTRKIQFDISPSSLPNISKIQSIMPDRPRPSSTTNRLNHDKLTIKTANVPDKLHSSNVNYARVATVPSVNFDHDKLPARTANVPDKLHSSNVNYARPATVPSVNSLHSPPSGLTPSGATNVTSPEQFAFMATKVQGTPDTATEQILLDLRLEIDQLQKERQEVIQGIKQISGDAGTSSEHCSVEQDTAESYKQHGNHIRFHVTSAPKEEREAAHERIQKALNRVPTRVSEKRTGNRTRCDLYIGNLAFNADCDDLFESIRHLFKKRIHVENVSIPTKKGGGNRGYGFIALSWASGAPIDPADICTQLSGQIKVNSRRIYLCETKDTTSDHSESVTDSSISSDCSDSGPEACLAEVSDSGGESEVCYSDDDSADN